MAGSDLWLVDGGHIWDPDVESAALFSATLPRLPCMDIDSYFMHLPLSADRQVPPKAYSRILYAKCISYPWHPIMGRSDWLSLGMVPCPLCILCLLLGFTQVAPGAIEGPLSRAVLSNNHSGKDHYETGIPAATARWLKRDVRNVYAQVFGGEDLVSRSRNNFFYALCVPGPTVFTPIVQ